MKLFTYYKSPETPAQACATTPKMYVVSINGVKPTDSGWHAFVNKNNTNQKVSFTTNCLDEKESTFNPDIPTWNQSVIMNWYTSTSGTMVGRMWFSGDTTSYKNRLYKNKQDTQQEYGYPQYDTDVLYNCP